jgi:hypothetical protein
MKRCVALCGGLALALLAACTQDGGTVVDDVEAFVASLSSDNIVGEDVVSTATGVSNITYDGEVLEYTIDVQDMDEIIAAHIHAPASTSQNQNVALTLFAPSAPTGLVNGRLVGGVVGPTSPAFEPGITLDDVLRWIRADSAYVMVHSSTYPNGEIRGHLVPD